MNFMLALKQQNRFTMCIVEQLNDNINMYGTCNVCFVFAVTQV